MFVFRVYQCKVVFFWRETIQGRHALWDYGFIQSDMSVFFCGLFVGRSSNYIVPITWWHDVAGCKFRPREELENVFRFVKIHPKANRKDRPSNEDWMHSKHLGWIQFLICKISHNRKTYKDKQHEMTKWQNFRGLLIGSLWLYTPTFNIQNQLKVNMGVSKNRGTPKMVGL